MIVVDADRRGPLVSSVVVTSAAPTYAGPGQVLVSSSALGIHAGAEAERRARDHLAVMYGVGTSRWRHVATYPVRGALPAMSVPFDVRRPVHLGDGLYVAGDHRDTSSIQGALVSGRRAADAVIAESLALSSPDG